MLKNWAVHSMKNFVLTLFFNWARLKEKKTMDASIFFGQAASQLNS